MTKEERNLQYIRTERLVVIKLQVKSAMTKMNRNQVSGPHRIAHRIEIILRSINETVNEIYNSGETPEDFNRSIFITYANPTKIAK